MSKGNKKKSKLGKKNPKYVKKIRKSAKMGLSTGEARLLTLLRDPCNADFTEPAYSGGGTGLFYRTRNMFQVGGIGTTESCNFVVSVSPGNISTAGTSSNYFIASGANASLDTISLTANTSESNVINISGSVVNSARPVAACIKWVPNGRYGYRRGTIGLQSHDNTPYLTGGQSYDINDVLSNSLHIVGNGDEKHEVIFIPTEHDGQFQRVNAHSFDPKCASMTIIGVDVDTTAYVGPGGDARWTAAGFFEVVVVWEWEANAGQGLTNVRKSPPKTTLNALLSKVEDLSSFALTGAVRKVSQSLLPRPVVKGIHGISSVLHGMEALLR